MSRYGYIESQEISKEDYSFEGLLMAAIRKADSENLARLRSAFTEIVDEFAQRYNAPGGVLPSDAVKNEVKE